jgi:hypothetical protein
VLFSGNDIDSFATTRLFGTALLRIKCDESAGFFIEELAHQCGHILFAALTQEPATFYVLDPSTPLAVATPIADYRTVDVLCHAVFTECAMCVCLGHSLEQSIDVSSLRNEMLGRLGFALRRLYADLRTLLTIQHVFTPKGQAWCQVFVHYLEYAVARWGRATAELHYHNQPYGFDVKAFRAANPRIDTCNASQGV